MAILPVWGVARPATQSSSVVLPAPDGPKIMVIPGAIVNATSSVKLLALLEKRLWRATARPSAAAELVGRFRFSVPIGGWFQQKRKSQTPAAHCTRKSPLPLLPSGPGGVGGNASRGTDA